MLKYTFRISSPLLFFIAAAALFISSSQALAASLADDDAHRLIGLIGYVGADYAGAVEDGEIIDQFEYDEQIAFLNDAQELGALAGGLAAEVKEPLDKLFRLVEEKADADLVREAAQQTNRAAIDYYQIVLAPRSAPDLARGGALFAENCASCHGDTGRADTPMADTLDPEPTDFTDPEVLEVLSPYRAHNTTTFGLSGTAMVGYPQLSDEERWDLAFYIMALGHGGPAEEARSRTPDGFQADMITLASLSDGELLESLLNAGASAEEAAASIHALRANPPVDELPKRSSKMEVAQRHVQAAQRAWENGEPTQARKELISGYLDGFEHVETRLGSIDMKLMRSVEQKFMDLRSSIQKDQADQVAQDFQELDQLLKASAAALSTASADAWSTALASGIIMLREGLEIILLLALLLGITRRLGLEEARKYIHLGWTLAMVAGAATWVAAQKLITISGLGRELIEGAVGILAALVLFSVSYWFMSKLHGEKWTFFIKTQLEERIKSGNLWAIAGLSFLAVYRELLEVILFFQAIILESTTGTAPIISGVAVAAVLLAAVAFLILKVGARLPLKPMFAISGAMLYALAIMMMGSGLQALIEADILPLIRVPGVHLPWLGIYPQLIPLLAQALMLALAGIWAASSWRARSNAR